MITQKEFLEIIEKHLKIRDDGTVYIEDPKLAKEVAEYCQQFEIDLESYINSQVAKGDLDCITVIGFTCKQK